MKNQLKEANEIIENKNLLLKNIQANIFQKMDDAHLKDQMGKSKLEKDYDLLLEKTKEHEETAAKYKAEIEETSLKNWDLEQTVTEYKMKIDKMEK